MEATRESATTDGPFVLLSGRVGLAGEHDASVGGLRQRRLLAGLAARRGQIVSADWLTDVVWYGDDPPDAAPKTIRTYVYRLRKALADNSSGVRLETIDGAYRLDCPASALDIDVFTTHAGAAKAAEDSGSPGETIVEADRALRLWHGEPFGEFAGEPWAVAEASRLNEVRASVEERRAVALGATGRFDEAVAELEGLARAMPLREPRCELLARALVRVGRPGDALREISRLRDTLRTEQGLDPTYAIVELERRILNEDPSLLQSTVLRTIGSFELTEQLDSGTDWSSWRGQHPSLDHEVRIVSFGVTVADDPRFVRNFDSQLRRISRLEHPAIVAVEDYWREPGSAHVVTRMLRGPSLEMRLESRVESVEGFEVRFDDFVEQIGGAVAASHGEGVAHGAIGPRTVVSDHLGNWYLGGFANADAILGSATLAGDLFDLGELLRTVATASGSGADVIPDARGDDVHAYLGELRARTRPALRAPATDSAHRLARNPYPGLRAFDDSERRVFFGRDALINDVISGLSDYVRFTVIIGASGTGKSSLLHAGIIPALAEPRSDRMLIARMTPGHAPYDRLAAALVSISTRTTADRVSPERIRDDGLAAVVRDAAFDGADVLLAVDQLEELFTLSGDERDSTAFLESLFAAATEPDLPLRVILTLRSDHFGALLNSEAIASSLSGSLVPVRPFSADELQSVITGPAHLAGVDVEARLASALTAELADRPSLLPHLQHLMRQLFDGRDGNLLAYRDYEELGGVTGSLGRAGEDLLDRLTAAEAQALRRVFRRLSHIGPDGDVSRQRIAVADLAAGPEGDRALRMLGAERLVVFDHDPLTRAPTVEITHEAIFRAWPRLAEWLREDSDIARLLEDLNERSRSWIQLDRDLGELLHGVRLEQVLDALPTVADELSARELEFVEASKRARDEEIARDLRRRRRLRVSLGIALVGLIASMSAGLYALGQRSDAEEAAAAAQQNATAAEISQSEAIAQAELAEDAAQLAEEQRAIADRRLLLGSVRLLLDENPRLGLLLANQLYGSDPSFETLSLLQEALVDLPRGLERFFGDAAPYQHVSLSTDGSKVAGLTQTHLEVWDTESGEQILRRAAPAARDFVVSSTDVFVVDDLGGVSQMTFETQASLELNTPFAARSIALHDELVIVGGDGGGVAYLPVNGTWTELSQGMGFPVNRVQVGADGIHVVATSITNGAPATIWNLETGEFVNSHGHRGPHGIQHTRDAIIVGDSLASIGPDSNLQIRSLPELSLVASVDFVGSRLEPIDDETFLAIGESGWLSVRSIATGAELDRFVGTATQRSGELSVSGDGTTAALATPTGVELWSLEGGRALAESIVLDGPLEGFIAQHTVVSTDGLFPVVRVDLANPGLVIFKDGEPTTLWDQAGLPNAMNIQIFDDLGVVFSSDLSLRFVAFDGDTIQTLPDVGLNGLSESDTWAAARYGDTIAVVTGRTDSRIAIVERTRPDVIELVATLPFSGTWPAIGFSMDGRFLAALASGDQITVWDTSTWELAWEANDLFVNRVVGATMIGDDEVLVLTIDGGVHRGSLSAPSTTHLQQLSTSGFPISNFTYLLDSNLLLTAAPHEVGGSARLWDLDIGSQIGVSFPAAGEGSWLSADDELVTGEGLVTHLWPVDIATWPDHACRIAGRSLTSDEWSGHGPTGVAFEPVCS